MKVILFLFISLCFAQDNEGAKDLYFKGIKAYQNSEWQASRDFFVSALEDEPNNVSLLFNWGLAEMKLGKPGLAIAAWRKALWHSPSFLPAAEALAFALTQVQSANAQQSSNSLYSLVKKQADRTSWHLLLSLNLGLLLGFSLILLRYWGGRRTALEEETALPQPPYWGILLFLFFAFTIFLSGQKYLSSSQIRATIIAESVNMYTGPSQEDSALFEIFEGFEVIVKKRLEKWVQVQIPDGVTGWVPSEVLFYTQEIKK